MSLGEHDDSRYDGLPAYIESLILRGDYATAAKALNKLRLSMPKKETIKQKMKRGGGFNKGGHSSTASGKKRPTTKKRSTTKKS